MQLYFNLFLILTTYQKYLCKEAVIDWKSLFSWWLFLLVQITTLQTLIMCEPNKNNVIKPHNETNKIHFIRNNEYLYFLIFVYCDTFYIRDPPSIFQPPTNPS